MRNRIISGYVTQVCNDKGECQSQAFTAGAEAWEDGENGVYISPPDNFNPLYAFPLDMVQPDNAEKLADPEEWKNAVVPDEADDRIISLIGPDTGPIGSRLKAQADLKAQVAIYEAEDYDRQIHG